MFVGSTSGNRFDGALRASGDYRIRVYLMRAAGRRGEQTGYSLKVRVGGGHAGTEAPESDFADRLAGGPDFWEVTGVPVGDTLLRAGPSARDPVGGEIGNGARLCNLGCRMTDGQRWCRVS